ncbi:2-deoxyglucose-6-phosphate phosphatase [Cystobasidium minutum MCA 4210]|uniref:2-deoxyglucose-6-phosphate phosphatase n=1 Tax=Cystobasidium minutum MCA 4210 TaxID=1397322 RepID=UPI0034CF99B7|eukprot:jgi/Rhomi1/30346/CE30345_4689
MASTPPKAFIFDLLTALLDSWSLWSHCAGSDELGKQWRLRYIDITYACGSYKPYESLVAEAAESVREKHGAPLPKGAEERLVQEWEEYLLPWDDTISTLKRLENKYPDAKFGVFTNCSVELGHAAARKSEDPKQGVVFGKVLTAEEIGYYKPHPSTYKAILDALSIEDPHDAVFVAGSSVDVPGSKEAGMRVVWHNRAGMAPKNDVKPDKEGKTLEEALSDYL